MVCLYRQKSLNNKLQHSKTQPQIVVGVACLFFSLFLSFSSTVHADESQDLQIIVDTAERHVLFQQDLYIPLTLKNTGDQALSLTLPAMDESAPIVKLTNSVDNISQQYQREVARGAVQHEAGSLLPGDEVETGFNLFDIVTDLNPGGYKLNIIWPYNNNVKLASSADIPVSIQPVSPRYMHTENAVGGRSDLLFGVWTNKDKQSGKTEIIRSRFSLRAGGGVEHVKKVADCHRCSPVISAPAVNQLMTSQWIAWTQKDQLYYRHVDDKLDVGELHQHSVSKNKTQIVSPLFCEEVVDTRKRPAGKLILMEENPDKKSFVLKVLGIGRSEISTLNEINVKGKKPVWIKNHVNADKEIQIYFLQQNGGKLRLKTLRIVNSGDNKVQILKTWKANFIAANSIINSKNDIHGGILMVGKNDKGKKRLLLRRWHKGSGAIDTDYSEVNWPANRKIKSAHISIDDNGRLATILRGTSRFWHVVKQNGELSPVPELFQQSSRALQLAFMEGDGELLLIAGTRQKGFQLVMQDGSPLPPSGANK